MLDATPARSANPVTVDPGSVVRSPVALVPSLTQQSFRDDHLAILLSVDPARRLRVAETRSRQGTRLDVGTASVATVVGVHAWSEPADRPARATVVELRGEPAQRSSAAMSGRWSGYDWSNRGWSPAGTLVDALA